MSLEIILIYSVQNNKQHCLKMHKFMYKQTHNNTLSIIIYCLWDSSYMFCVADITIELFLYLSVFKRKQVKQINDPKYITLQIHKQMLENEICPQLQLWVGLAVRKCCCVTWSLKNYLVFSCFVQFCFYVELKVAREELLTSDRQAKYRRIIINRKQFEN